MATDALTIWQIDPLPDFLTDHTLTGQNPAERLREYAARWVQLSGSLWEWQDRATFALRYLAAEGRISIFLLCAAHRPEDSPRLQSELDVILRAHRLKDCSRIVSSEVLDETASLGAPVIAQVRQHESWSLWTVPEKRAGDISRKGGEWSGIRAQEWQTPRVVYPWWGPGGPFLLPMESLVSQPVPCSLTIYLEPTRLRPMELRWLSLMAREAQTAADQSLQEAFVSASTRVADPAAGLAGRLYLANLRRLSAAPFMVTVHCAAPIEHPDVALSLAGAVQSLVHEPAFERPQQEDDRLPAGATVLFPSMKSGAEQFQSFARRQYERLRFEEPANAGVLFRLADLADAQGAATVFRLPVSVRGGVPGVRVRQLSPDFHPGARMEVSPPGTIRIGEYHSGGTAFVPVKDLTKHTLITGFTGSGKTVTVLQLLHRLWADPIRIPFLVIESAKQEYRGLIGVPQFRGVLRIYTLGNETCVPFRLNPFQLIPGVRVEAHLNRLQTCFEAAIPPVGPSGSIIAESLQNVYERFGWRLTDIYSAGQRRRFPELVDFVEEVKQVLSGRNYQGEVLANLEAALVGRFRPLLIGSKGSMFGVQLSEPAPEELFRWPTVLEMNDLNLDDKALVTMFVLTLLREYRDIHRSTDGSLVHVTMVEEAHNILEEVGSNAGPDAASGDARHKAVQAFCSLLTEIRALGEGLIIADQSPTKLARDAMRNTNLQIAHQLRDGEDRKAVANAMIMENEQRDFLGKLPPGNAAVFRTGLEKATFVRVDKYYPDGKDLPVMPPESTAEWKLAQTKFVGLGFKTKVNDPEVRQYMSTTAPASVQGTGQNSPFPRNGCQLCRRQCDFRDGVFWIMSEQDGQTAAAEWLEHVQEEREQVGQASDESIIGLGVARVKVALPVLSDLAEDDILHAGWCLFVHMVDAVQGKGWKLTLRADDRELFDTLWLRETASRIVNKGPEESTG